MLHEDREKRRWETFRKSGEWRETTPCVKLTIALFSQSRVRVFNNATIHSCAHTLFSILAVSRHRRRSPLPLLSIDVSFFAFARLRSSQSFQSFPLERRATLSYPFTPPPPATYPSTNNKSSTLVACPRSHRQLAQCAMHFCD